MARASLCSTGHLRNCHTVFICSLLQRRWSYWFQTMALNLCHMSLKHISRTERLCTENHLSIIREREEQLNTSTTASMTVCKPLCWKESHGRSSHRISYTYIMQHFTPWLSSHQLNCCMVDLCALNFMWLDIHFHTVHHCHHNRSPSE